MRFRWLAYTVEVWAGSGLPGRTTVSTIRSVGYISAMAGELGFDTGPFVNLATFCEQVIQDKSDVMTLVRIVDRITLSAHGGEAPDDLPTGAVVNTNLVIGLCPGDARGSQKVQVTVVHPDGTRHPGPVYPVHFTQGANQGANLLIQLEIVLSTQGLYWTDIAVNGRLVTRVPLEVRYQVIPPGMQAHQ